MHEILDKCAPIVEFVKLLACGEHMIPCISIVKPDGKADVVPDLPKPDIMMHF